MSIESNKKRSELLGEVYSSARARLTRILLFQLAKETNKDICFQCGKKIEKVEDLSIEHKKSWMNAENPKKSFYDLNNIAFSHILCNSVATTRWENPSNYSGEKSPNSKLTSVQVKEIKEKLKNGYGLTVLSKEYNVSKRNISLIRDNKRWKNV